MRRAALVLLSLLVAGCSHTGPTPTTSPGPQQHFLDDGADADVEPFADLLWAEFRELNGSVVLFMEFENMKGRIPEFLATFDIDTGDAKVKTFLRNQPNRSREPSYMEYVLGHVTGDTYIVDHEVCAITEISQPPWRIRVEAEHRNTGLMDGGRIDALRIQTGDFENNVKDTATTSKAFSVKGGPNPHPSCPLVAERPE